MTKRESNYILIWAKKIKAVNILGGKCGRCGDDNIFHLALHHKNPKDKISGINNLKFNRWSIIEKEVNKCELLCHNCHQEHHYKNNNSVKKFNKLMFFEFKKATGCIICGYNKCIDSLNFHHNQNIKNFEFGYLSFRTRIKSIGEIKKKIVDELNMCDVVCANCHAEKHINIKLFNKNYNLIIKKSNNIKENNNLIDKEIVRKLYFEDGMKQIDIVKKLNSKRGTIFDIIKKFKLQINI